jgi:hypothetical protein
LSVCLGRGLIPPQQISSVYLGRGLIPPQQILSVCLGRGLIPPQQTEYVGVNIGRTRERKAYLLLRGRRSASDVTKYIAVEKPRKRAENHTMKRGDEENDVGGRKDRAVASGDKKTEGRWL